MQTAVSIPDDLFSQAESLSERLNVSRDDLYAAALRDYLNRYDEDEITRALNDIYTDEHELTDSAVTGTALHTLRRSEW